MTLAPIHDDAPDAIDQLRARIATLTDQLTRYRDYNKSCKAAARAAKKAGTVHNKVGDLTILDESQKRDLIDAARYSFPGKNGEFPSYVTTNLAGNLKRYEERLARLERAEVKVTEVGDVRRVEVGNLANYGIVRETDEWSFAWHVASGQHGTAATRREAVDAAVAAIREHAQRHGLSSR